MSSHALLPQKANAVAKTMLCFHLMQERKQILLRGVRCFGREFWKGNFRLVVKMILTKERSGTKRRVAVTEACAAQKRNANAKNRRDLMNR